MILVKVPLVLLVIGGNGEAGLSLPVTIGNAIVLINRRTHNSVS